MSDLVLAGAAVVGCWWLQSWRLPRRRLQALRGTARPWPEPFDVLLPKAWALLRWRPARDHSGEVIAVADAWSAELMAGRPPAQALSAALTDAGPSFVPVARAIALGADPPPALRTASRARGAEGLSALAAAWEVSVPLGGALSDTVASVASALRDEAAVRLEIQAQLAAPRATARMVAALPVAGPLIGAVMGVDVLSTLIGTTAGRVMLVAGLTLNALGWWWVHRILRGAAESA